MIKKFLEFINENNDEYDEFNSIDSKEEFNYKKIISTLGKPEYYPSAEWGGIDVWSLNGMRFTGTFLVVDDNQDVIILNREENLDPDPETSYIDTQIMTEPLDGDLTEILKKAIEIKQRK
jgi:hypothetical protein